MLSIPLAGRPCAVVLLLFALVVPAAAQDRAATEQRLEALREQISGVQGQIQQAQTEEAGALAALDGISTEIRLREELVNSYRSQLDTLRRETNALRSSIQRLEGEIEEARTSYRQHARHAYTRGRPNDLALILSAGTIAQMVARARYLRQFAERRRRQVSRIAEKTTELRFREQSLNASVQETQRFLTASQFEQSELTQRRREREGLVQQARRRRSQLESELAQRQADAQALEGLVAELVAAERRREEEARRQREAAAEESRREAALAELRRREAAQGNPSAAAEEPAAPPALPPAESRSVTLTGSFRANRSRLPWPADGTVTGTFGTRTDPVYGTRIEEVGIDITTAPGAGVRAIFEGTVERILVMSAYGTVIVVSHGDFHSLYGNLSQVNVQQGARVQAGQAVGRAGTAEQRRGPGLFFAIFQGEQAVNPTSWLRGR